MPHRIIQTYFPQLSAQQLEQFSKLDALYRDWNAKINVISRKDIDQLYLHHVLHSLAIARYYRFTPGTKILDFGTGGGFPGIPLAIMLPQCTFKLIDGTGKKIRVAQEVINAIGLKNCEAVHLRAHAGLARHMGIDPERIFVVDNGDTLEMRNRQVRIGQPVDSGVVYVDGLSVTDADPVVLRDRQKLAQDGIVTCVVSVSHRSHRARDVEIYSRGVSFANDEELTLDAQDIVRARVDGNPDASVDQLRKSVRNGLSNFLWSRTHTRPMVIPVVMEV